MNGTAQSPVVAAEKQELVERLWAGDQRAFESVFRAHYANLADYANGLVNSRDAAEDVVQDVFVTLWTQRRQLTSPENLPAYLYRAVRNRALNQLRHQRLVARWQARQTALGTPAAPAANVEVERAELSRAIKQATATLSPRCREVFELSRERHLTYPKIAETLGISIKTVETLMGRALRAVRIQLASYKS